MFHRFQELVFLAVLIVASGVTLSHDVTVVFITKAIHLVRLSPPLVRKDFNLMLFLLPDYGYCRLMQQLR